MKSPFEKQHAALLLRDAVFRVLDVAPTVFEITDEAFVTVEQDGCCVVVATGWYVGELEHFLATNGVKVQRRTTTVSGIGVPA